MTRKPLCHRGPDSVTNFTNAEKGDCEVLHSTFYCNCFDGYSGQSCQNNPCDPDPCENHGICNFNDDGADCNCPDGFSGDRCEITPCTPEPCNEYALVDPIDCKEANPQPKSCDYANKCILDGYSYKVGVIYFDPLKRLLLIHF